MALEAHTNCLFVVLCSWEAVSLSKASPIRFVVAVISGILVLAACGGGSSEEPSTDPSTSTVGAETDVSPVSEEQLAAATVVGDIAAGEALYREALDGIPHSVSCSTCHSLKPEENYWSPTFAGISSVAPARVAGMSATDYLRQSIVLPYEYRVEGEWASAAMPLQYADVLSEDQVNNLIAFLLIN